MEAEQNKPVDLDEERVARIQRKPEILQFSLIGEDNMSVDCNHCHKKESVFLWSFIKKNMETYTCQLLMERGWTRCGTFYYKSILTKSCCKIYAHRLEAAKFRPNKDQKKAVKKVVALAYQKMQEKQGKKNSITQKTGKNTKQEPKFKQNIKQIQQQTVQGLLKICEQLNNTIRPSLYTLLAKMGITQEKFAEFTFEVRQKLKFFVSKPGDNSDYYCNYVMLLYGLNKKLFLPNKYSLIDFSKDVKESIETSKVIQNYGLAVERGYLLFKKESTAQNLSSPNKIDKSQNQAVQKQKLESQIYQTCQKYMSQTKKTSTQVKSQKMQTKLLQQKCLNNYQLLSKYKGELNISFNKITFGKITIDIVPAQESAQSFKLYQQYCYSIHQSVQTEMNAYINFLCLQALQYRKQRPKINNQAKKLYIPSWDPNSKYQSPKKVEGQVQKLLGCYHMKYYLQGKLLAVGVVDILDEGLSSCYFFYNPAFKQNRIGVFSSLIEIEYIRWMGLSFPEFKYYYMGYYVPNCRKMSYKVNYMPCELLCPITYRFVQFSEQIKLKIEKVVNKQENDLKIAKNQEDVIQDMSFKRSLEPFIDKNMKLSHDGRPIILKKLSPVYLLDIYRKIKILLPVLGKKVFEMLTFTV